MKIREEAAADAERILADIWNGEPPVDPELIAEAFGIKVDRVRFKGDISGALVKEIGRDPSILLNKVDSENRQRFTLAHELGHFVRREDQHDAYEYVDMRNSLSATGFDEEERYANQFAACLLMPERLVNEYQEEGLTEAQMALRFAVSRDAMTYRIRNLEDK